MLLQFPRDNFVVQAMLRFSLSFTTRFSVDEYQLSLTFNGVGFSPFITIFSLCFRHAMSLSSVELNFSWMKLSVFQSDVFPESTQEGRDWS